MVLSHARPAVTSHRPRLRVTVLCPSETCNGRVDFEARTFRGVPMTGSCSTCGSSFELSGGLLRSTEAGGAITDACR